MQVMISQPMKGKTEERIRQERESAVSYLEGHGHEVVDTIFNDFIKNPRPLHFLAKSIEVLADLDAVAFLPGWKDARGCRIEHACAVEYGKFVLELVV
jgi:hypothetical protein